ncbi:MAG: hypothetical protein RI907_3107 [Pseudomonadota bacterium]
MVCAVPALLVAGAAQAEPELRSAPFGVTVGIGGGFAPTHRTCAGANKEGCDRLSFGHKVWLGYNVTNDVDIVVSNMYFNGVNRDWSVERNALNARERVSSQAYTAGIDWHIDLLHSVTNHLRTGMARLETRQTNYLRAGGTEFVRDIKLRPYVGAGLELHVNEYLSLEASFDYIFASSKSRHLLFIGAVGSF